MNHSCLIKTTDLTYCYANGSKTLNNVNLSVEKGAIYGFLGPNGSGKTTTLSLLLGLLEVQQGKIEMLGQSLKSKRVEILSKIGSLIESPSPFGHLTAVENLEVYRTLYEVNKQRVRDVLEIAGLSTTGKKKVKHFSLGMKQRLAIAMALLPKPELLILDEPANGLDPTGIIELRELIKHLNREEGMTILISSHILAEVEKMVTHIGIISRGQLLFQGPIETLNQVNQHALGLMIRTSDNDLALKLLQTWQPSLSGQIISLRIANESDIATINQLLVDHQIRVYLLQPKEQDLEQVFIQLTAPV